MQGTQGRFTIDSITAAPRARVRRVLSSFAAQDWLVASYMLVLLLGVLRGAGPRREAGRPAAVVIQELRE